MDTAAAELGSKLSEIHRERLHQADITASGFGRPGSTGCPSTLLVTVSDTGCGISKQGQESLFEKYQQVHSQEREHRGPSATTGSGTGLGLVICQHIVELMGGQISVKSPLSTVCTRELVPALRSVSVSR